MKKGLFPLAAFFLSVLLSGCYVVANSDSAAYYKVECGLVTNSVYYTALGKMSYWDEATYSRIAAIRDYLYRNTISDYDCQSGVSIYEIKGFLLSKNMSNYEAERLVSSLKRIGNYVVFAEPKYGYGKMFWLYAKRM